MFNKIKNIFISHNKTHSSDAQEDVSVHEKEVSVFGEQRLQRQKLFEKWAVKERWNLKQEGILLLLALDPESSNDINESDINELWHHAFECVNNKLLTVHNPEATEDEWYISPANLYCWAKISRIEVPEELTALMDFVMQSMKPVQSSIEPESLHKDNDNNDGLYQLQREQVLGAALSLLINSPDSCKSNSGRISHNKITEQILAQSKQWMGDNELLLSQSVIKDLIEQYVQKGKNQYSPN